MSDNLDLTPQLTLTPEAGHRCGAAPAAPGGTRPDPGARGGGPG